jgi:MFS superfamily sulfate permease-like transporter
VGIVIVSLTDTIATASSFAARRGEEVKPNQEIIGIGTANVAAALFQGFAVSTSSSRTAVAERSGAKSQAAGIVGAAVVALLLVFFNSLLADLPQSALGGVVIFAAFSLVDLGALRWYARARSSAIFLSLATTVGVIAFGVLEGIAIAIALDVLAFFRRSWWPHGEVLGRVAGSGWHSVVAYPDAEQVGGIVVYRWEAPLFFANARAFREQIRLLVRERSPCAVVVQCEAITDVDVTGAQVLAQLDGELRGQGVELALAELRTRLQEVLEGFGLFEGADTGRFFPAVDTAVRTIQGECR